MPTQRLTVETAEANLVAASADLVAARSAGDEARVALLDALVGSGAALLIYRPARDHYGLLLGSMEQADHVAVMVPGVGTDVNLQTEWLPSAANLFEAAESTSVILWKAYDEPADLVSATLRTVGCDDDLLAAAAALTEFVRSLPLRPDQSLTLVAHSFGSIVTGTALADCGLECTDVVVAGSPGMNADDLRQLHLQAAHFFAEEAPGDPVAELGIFGAEPTSPVFGGTRMRTNAPGHAEVSAHSHYFLPGSESLENIVDVVTGRYAEVTAQEPSLAESAGGLVAWALRLPTMPVGVMARHYRGPGFRLLVNTRHAADLAANAAGTAVQGGLDVAGRVVARVEHRFAGHRMVPTGPSASDHDAAGRRASPPAGPDEESP